LDVDFGTYPFVTSSSASVGGVFTGLGIGPQWLDEVYGVAKAYCTRVGEGPFPSEMDEAFSDKIRRRGAEYGATTGRPRRCGWMDLVAMKYACRINGLTGILLTKVDVLSYLKTIKLCVAYKIKGKRIEEFPAGLQKLSRCEPVYKEMKGWDGDLSKASGLKDLPKEARLYLDAMEKALGVPIAWVSVGPDRAQIFKKN
jgi:adenylosuccinate synthase